MGVGDAHVLGDEGTDERPVLEVAGAVVEREEALRREMLHDLVVLDLHVEALLVPVDQLLQRRRQLRYAAITATSCPMSS